MHGLERYQLLEEVGHGGMSTVWRGRDTALGREVAVKVLHAHLAEEQDAKARFAREAQAVAKLHHPNILQIYDFSGLDSPSSYIVTEFISGQTLKQFVATYPITLPEIAVAIVAEVARALMHAHSLQVIHRDLKPENVMIRQDGVLKLMDFGIAQVLDIQRMTATGELIGSPAYMAPEQVEGKPIDFRTDIFSLGTLLYQLATGELPFRGRNPHEVLKRISECQYVAPKLACARVDDRLQAIIERALSRNPAERFPTAATVVAELEGYLAQAGLGDGRDALKTFFVDPTGSPGKLGSIIVTALVAQGQSAFAAGKTAQGYSLINRALCRDPKNPEVLVLLDRLAKRRRVWKALVSSGALAALLAAAVFANRYWPNEVTDADAPHAPMTTAPQPATQPTAPDPVSPKKAQIPLASSDPSPSVDLTPPDNPVPVVREIEIIPWPRAVRMQLDDQDLGWYGPDNSTLRVGPGAHKLVLTNSLCQPLVISIGANDRREELRPRLVWKPARVTVRTNVPAAEIVVAGQVGRPGEALKVPLPAGPAPEAQVPLVVRAAGYELHTASVHVRAGETMPDVSVVLRPK